jgi:hypothetical protein
MSNGEIISNVSFLIAGMGVKLYKGLMLRADDA